MDDLGHFPAQTETYVGCLVSGLRVRWYERGPLDGREGAPTILCLHGFPELAVSWSEQFAGLADHYRIVAPDMRGYGGTDAPARVRDYTLDTLVRDVVELIDALGVDKVHLVGHDWGAVVAWEVAMRHDSRLHSLCAINCPPLHLFARELLRPEQLRRSWYVLFFQLPRIPEWRMRGDEDLMTQVFMANAHNHAPFTRERLEPYLRQIRTRGVHGINYYRAAPLSLLRRPAPIFVPTRLIWGLKDPALGPWFAEPSLYEGWVERFDRVVIEDAGHFPGQEQPGQVNAALREHVERVTPTSGVKTEAAS